MIVDSIYFKGHTCFKNEWSGFETIKPINVIIGRNNSGKSRICWIWWMHCAPTGSMAAAGDIAAPAY